MGTYGRETGAQDSEPAARCHPDSAPGVVALGGMGMGGGADGHRCSAQGARRRCPGKEDPKSSQTPGVCSSDNDLLRGWGREGVCRESLGGLVLAGNTPRTKPGRHVAAMVREWPLFCALTSRVSRGGVPGTR